MRQWILSKGGKIYGPFSSEQLNGLYVAKKVTWTDLVVEFSDSPKQVEWMRVGGVLSSNPEEKPAAPVVTSKVAAADREPAPPQFTEVVLDTGKPESSPPVDLGFRRTVSGTAGFLIPGDGSGIVVGKGSCLDIGLRGMTISSTQIPGQRGSRVSLKIAPAVETMIPSFSTEAIIRSVNGNECMIEFTSLEEDTRSAIQLYVSGKVKLRKT